MPAFPNYPVLPTGPLPSAAMDYDQLRSEGIRLLGRLTGDQWSDYNAHDPGVTILEQLCYALTDLGYRLNYPMADLVAAGASEHRPPGPWQILPCDPVTAQDVRQLVLGVADVANVWTRPATLSTPVYYHAPRGELRFDPPSADAVPIAPKGLQHLTLQLRSAPSPDTLMQVQAALHAHRMLGMDFEVERVHTQEIGLQIAAEIDPAADPVLVLVRLIEAIEHYLAPPATFESLAQAAAAGQSIDKLLQGPFLQPSQNILTNLPDARATVHRSDLVRTVAAVPEVIGVREVVLGASPDQAPTSTTDAAPGTATSLWNLPIAAGHMAIPPTDIASPPQPGRCAGIALYRQGTHIHVDPLQVQALRKRRRDAATGPAPDMRELDPPEGRDRNVGQYASIIPQFPTTYGMRPAGLKSGASATRQAQALQLEAYLYIFDQILANSFAQLGHAHELLSYKPPSLSPHALSEHQPAPTYASQVAGEPVPEGTPPLVRSSNKELQDWLADAVQPDAPSTHRKRLLGHLLARYAEQVDPPLVHVNGAASSDARTVEQRQTFLARYPELSRGRGSGHNLVADNFAPSPYEARLRLKLALPADQRFLIVEHLLLHPLPGDSVTQSDNDAETPPLLDSVKEADPWSSRISLVFEDNSAKQTTKQQADLEQAIHAAIRSETPAHLTPLLLWFGADDYDRLLAAQQAHRAAQTQYLQDPTSTNERQVRALRDTVIDQLHYDEGETRHYVLGQTYPLRDIPLATTYLAVSSGKSSELLLTTSQADVAYWLVMNSDDATDGFIATEPTRGNGGPLTLATPPITQDGQLRVRAAKVVGNSLDWSTTQRQVWLTQTVQVQEGIDRTISTLSLIDATSGRALEPLPSASNAEQARVANYDSTVAVRIEGSQEGIRYHLFEAGAPDDALSEEVLGTGLVGEQAITLTLLAPASRDMTLKVRGKRQLASGVLDTAELDSALYLCVRANPLIATALTQAVLPYGDDSSVLLQDAQAGVRYQVYGTEVRSAMHYLPASEAPEPTTIAVEVSNGQDTHTVQLLAPDLPESWTNQVTIGAKNHALQPVSAELEGQDGPLALALDTRFASQDSLLLVKATKFVHQSIVAGQPPRPVSTALPLQSPLALLFRPQATPPLGLTVRLTDNLVHGPITLTNGEPGVFYTLYNNTGASLGAPLYFHQLSEGVAPNANRGVGELRVEQDLAIARPTDDDRVLLFQRLDPSLDLAEPLPVTDEQALTLVARKALSGTETPLSLAAPLFPAPALELQPPTGPAGTLFQLVVRSAHPGERYQVYDENLVVLALAQLPADAEPQDITLPLGSLTDSTRFELHIQRSGPFLTVTRLVVIPVDIDAGDNP